MIEFDPDNIATLARQRLETMRDAGDRVLECLRVLKLTDDNIVGELIKNEATFYEWNHYPDGDVYDPVSHSQYYYHAHPQEERSGEHGHFHTFLRPKGMPGTIKPAPVDDYEAPKDPDDALSHLVAISMNPAGLPIKLFVTNRWVMGEVWYIAQDVCRMLDYFAIDHTQPSWPVNMWVSAMAQLFDPQIRALVVARDVAVAAWRDGHPGANVFEDRDFEVAAALHIDIDTQSDAIARALAPTKG